MVVFVVKDKVGRFRLGLDESFGVKPFREFSVLIFSRVNKSIDSEGLGFQSIWHIQESNMHTQVEV